MSPPSLCTAKAGFTLIELVMAVAIMAILTTIAAPHLRDVVMNMRLTGQANDLLGALILARSEATKRDVRVTVCARRLNPGKSGLNVCTNGSQWANGWAVVVDADGNGQMDSTTRPLTVVQPLSGSNTVRNDGPGPKGTIIYTPTGINDSGPSTFFICDSRGKGRAVTVVATGRASVTRIESGCK